jgi:hypothetical protein
MAFKPNNPFEEIMVRAAADTTVRALFYRLLMETELYVLGEIGHAGNGQAPQTLLETDTLQIETIKYQNRLYHPLFSSEERVRTFASNSKVPFFSMQGRALFECTRGGEFLLNPGSELSKLLAADEITYWLEHAAEAAPVNISIVEPKVYPKKLVKALCVLFVSRSQVAAAHLAYVTREGSSGEPHPLIALVAEGDVQLIAQEIGEVAKLALPGITVDVVGLHPAALLDPFLQQIVSVAPFYRRMLPPILN